MSAGSRATSTQPSTDEGPKATEAGESSPILAGGAMEVDDEPAAGRMSRSTSGQDVQPASEGASDDDLDEAVRRVVAEVEAWCGRAEEEPWTASATALDDLLVSRAYIGCQCRCSQPPNYLTDMSLVPFRRNWARSCPQ